MAVFGVNFGELIANELRSKSGDAKAEGTVLTSILSDRVDSVASTGLKMYIATQEACAKALASTPPSMTKESAAFAVDCARRLAEVKTDYAVDFFKPRN